ncbi:hypothetical protein KI387_036969, partial [Taxus chinensis]
LKAYREDLFQHEIPLETNSKPFRQKQRLIDTLLYMKMWDELKQLKEGGIIQPI